MIGIGTVIWFIIMWIGLMVIVVVYRDTRATNERAHKYNESLDVYARDLEDWEIKHKVRSVALSNMFRYAKRLSDEDPRLAERFKRIKEELSPDEG